MKYIKLILLLSLLGITNAYAKCPTKFLNPVGDVNWQCAFPMNIGGVVSFGTSSENSSNDANMGDAFCSCFLTGGSTLFGVNVSFWEPSKLIETVKDPFCFPSIGTQLNPLEEGTLGGASSENMETTKLQVHYYHFPVWSMLSMFMDIPCLAGNRVDGGGAELSLSVITEVLPNWNNDLLSFLLNPEALLYGNPAAVATCMADAAAQALGQTIDSLFWCMGGWPGVYPVAGTVGTSNIVEASAVAGGRLIYQMGRSGILLDHGMDSCAAIRTLIWRKSNYRFHFAQPNRGSLCLNYGSPTPTWELNMNKAIEGDNFTHVLFRRIKCCVGY